MSNDATEQVENSAKMIPVARIYANPIFNSRGQVDPMSVFELARDIEKRGLIQPILVRPRTDETPPNYDYEIIAGHRRHMAHRVANIETIEAIIRTPKDDFEARSINIIENVQRNQLTFKQEARAIEHFFNAGWTRQKVAKELCVSDGWVQTRFMFLSFPEEVQDAIVAFEFSQQQIRDIYSLKSPEKQLEACRVIKNAKQSGIKNPRLSKKHSATRMRHRNKAEITRMNIYIQEHYKPCFATAALGWAAGNLTDRDLLLELKSLCEVEGVSFTLPEFDE